MEENIKKCMECFEPSQLNQGRFMDTSKSLGKSSMKILEDEEDNLMEIFQKLMKNFSMKEEGRDAGSKAVDLKCDELEHDPVKPPMDVNPELKAPHVRRRVKQPDRWKPDDSEAMMGA
uniref:Uncharacterized protein n=1 Tax=Panagrolaimus sp. JU765 TaxID=591449 RepID=A0AC34RPG0_9BILA